MQAAAVPFMVLDNAIGSIQPDDKQAERLDEFTDRVGSGEFLKSTDESIVCDCIDGRHGSQGALRPNAAGGSESLTVADDLTSHRFGGADSTTCGQYKATLAYLHDHHYPVGGHTCEGVSGTASGCGANDKLPAIYAFIAEHGDVLRSLVGALGSEVTDETHTLIVENAAKRSAFSDGSELLTALKDEPDARVSQLVGAHREVLALINNRQGTTLDRDAVREEFGDEYQAFNVDTWAFAASAKAIANDDTDAYQKLIAMLYYNLATAHVLVGPTLRVVVVNQ